MQLILLLVALEEDLQAGLLDGDPAVPEAFHLLNVNVYAGHIIAGFGKAYACDEAYISGSDYNYFH